MQEVSSWSIHCAHVHVGVVESGPLGGKANLTKSTCSSTHPQKGDAHMPSSSGPTEREECPLLAPSHMQRAEQDCAVVVILQRSKTGTRFAPTLIWCSQPLPSAVCYCGLDRCGGSFRLCYTCETATTSSTSSHPCQLIVLLLSSIHPCAYRHTLPFF